MLRLLRQKGGETFTSGRVTASPYVVWECSESRSWKDQTADQTESGSGVL